MILMMEIKDVLNEDYDIVSYLVDEADLKREYPEEYYALSEMSTEEEKREFFRLARRWLDWHDITVESTAEAKVGRICYN